jgi:hypothetical protein
MGHPAPAQSTGCAPDGPLADALGSAREVLYTGVRSLAQVSARAQGAFVADSADGLLRLPPGSADFVRIARAQVDTFLAADLSVYWASGSVLEKAALDATDAEPEIVAQGLEHGARFLSYDQTHLYFTDLVPGSIWQQPLAGTARTRLVGMIAVQDMKLASGYVYYTDGSSQRVFRVSVKGGDPELLATGMQGTGGVQAVATDGDNVYWVDDTQIEKTPIGSPTEVTTIGQGGAAPLGRGRVTSMTLVSDRLYWADDVYDVGWTAIDGSACGLVVKALPGLHGWDADDTAVYLTVPAAGAGSELWRIAR